jgi:hypothetical protein
MKIRTNVRAGLDRCGGTTTRCGGTRCGGSTRCGGGDTTTRDYYY